MIDRFGRTIDYMRVSITGRCNLRCTYCMPQGINLVEHSDILNYEEIMRICQAASDAGIVKFKVTGGEPLVRKGCVEFIARLKTLRNVEQVTLTTNGLLLDKNLDALCAAGINGINISLNTLCDREYRELTGIDIDSTETVLRTLQRCVKRGINTKVNAVLLARTFEGMDRLALLARGMPVDVRFIEAMPIGEGIVAEGVPVTAALERLRKLWPDLRPVNEKRGNGPAQYYTASGLAGRIGFIGAISSQFCESCNRIRLTATGELKPCLCYGEGDDLCALLRGGCTGEELRGAIQACIENKPQAHCLSSLDEAAERRFMSQIGG
jgi:cyclic pyranopterin phosphate synthase